MLRKNLKSKSNRTAGRFAIIASKYNSRYVDAMLNAANAELLRAGADVQIVRVPGAFEIPAVAAKLARAEEPFAAIICLGVIFRGQTDHAQQIANGVSSALAQLQILFALPVIHEVLLLENKEQANVRCLDKKHNRGTEAAQTALEMAKIMKGLSLDRAE